MFSEFLLEFPLSGLLLKTAKLTPPGNQEQLRIIHMSKHDVVTQHHLEQANVLC